MKKRIQRIISGILSLILFVFCVFFIIKIFGTIGLFNQGKILDTAFNMITTLYGLLALLCIFFSIGLLLLTFKEFFSAHNVRLLDGFFEERPFPPNPDDRR